MHSALGRTEPYLAARERVPGTAGLGASLFYAWRDTICILSSAAFQAAADWIFRLLPRAMPWAKGERPLRASSQAAPETGGQG